MIMAKEKVNYQEVYDLYQLCVTILFSALTHIIHKPTFAP